MLLYQFESARGNGLTIKTIGRDVGTLVKYTAPEFIV